MANRRTAPATLKARRARYRREGRCVSCGRRNDRGAAKHAQCSKCSRAWTERARRRAAAGKCRNCTTGGRATCGRFCRTCWFKRAAYRHLGSSARWAELAGLWRTQRGRCAYTGRRLVPGRGVALDHRVPVAKGGSRHTVTNLQWVGKAVNLAKHAQHEMDFIRMCIAVADGPAAARLLFPTGTTAVRTVDVRTSRR